MFISSEINPHLTASKTKLTHGEWSEPKSFLKVLFETKLDFSGIMTLFFVGYAYLTNKKTNKDFLYIKPCYKHWYEKVLSRPYLIETLYERTDPEGNKMAMAGCVDIPSGEPFGHKTLAYSQDPSEENYYWFCSSILPKLIEKYPSDQRAFDIRFVDFRVCSINPKNDEKETVLDWGDRKNSPSHWDHLSRIFA